MKHAGWHIMETSPERGGMATRERALTSPERERRASRARAFTLTELLAVITIIVVLISVAVPAFVGMLRSTNQALASSNFLIGVAAAKDAAVRSAGVSDAAAVFFYEPGGRTTIRTCLAVGQLEGRTIWAIDPLTEGISLPPGWMVNGFAPAGTIAPAGNGSGPTQLGQAARWYESTEDRYDPTRDNWVFPETGFFRLSGNGRDTTPNNYGEYRQSFMIRFDGNTGGVALDDRSEGLVFAPDNRIGRTIQNGWRQRGNGPHPVPRYRYDGSMRADEYIRRLLNRQWTTGGPDRLAELDLLLGKNSSDTVLVKPTTMLALYNVRDLAQEMVRGGAPAAFRGVNRVTGSLYEGPTAATSRDPGYMFEYAQEANAAIPEVARLFTVDRYNGGMVEVTP